MKKLAILFSVASICTLYFLSCKKDTISSASTSGEAYLDLSDSNATYFAKTSSQPTKLNELAFLGRVLFYDRHLSVNNSVACGSCHKQAYAFADNVAFSRGFENRLTGRNSSQIENLVSTKTFNGVKFLSNESSLFWDGRQTGIADMVTQPIGNHVEMGIEDLSTLPAKLSGLPYYRNLFKRAYGNETITVDRISESIGTFMCTLNADSSRFDQHFFQNKPNLTAQELYGRTLFITKYACGNCHHFNPGAYFSNGFRDIGLDEKYTDKGRGAISGVAEDNGTFKTPNLKNVAVTAPYMHDGRYKTLKDVLKHYSKGMKNSPNLSEELKGPDGKARKMDISEEEEDAIIAFLNTLTDNNLLTNSKYSDPFKTK